MYELSKDREFEIKVSKIELVVPPISVSRVRFEISSGLRIGTLEVRLII